MEPVCRITTDAREEASGVPHALAERGIDVCVERLPVADYALPNGVLVERKTTRGLHLAVVDGRLWRQIGDVRQASRAPYLLVEGPDLDDGPLTPAAVRGVCLTIIGHGVPILWALDAQQSAVWLDQLVSRASAPRVARDRPVYAQMRKPRGDRVPEAMLAAIPGISTKRAAALLAAFGSVAAVGTAGIDQLLRVRGIGPTEAQRVREAFS